MNGSGVAAGESLGNRIYSREQARVAQQPTGRGRLASAFVPDETHRLSVDRITIADMQHVTRLAVEASVRRHGEFRGWACVTREIAERKGRRVVASPTAENRYHGDIIFPDKVGVDKGERRRHARELADGSEWRDPGTGVAAPAGAAIH